MIKLVLSDMDGTLVPFGHKSVSPRTRKAIRTLQARGIMFGPASGREPVDLIGQFDGDASCFATGILANGKIVRKDGRNIFTRALDHDALVRLDAVLKEAGDAALLIYVPLDSEINRSERAILVPSGEEGEKIRKVLDPFFPTGYDVAEGIPSQPIYTAGVICPTEEAADALRPTLEAECPRFDFVKPTPFFFDVLPKGTSKASALKIVEAKFGISLDEIVFFGDSENDLALLEALPNSIAVENGTPAAQAAARYHIADAADDSVAQVMEAIARTGELDIPAAVSRD